MAASSKRPEEGWFPDPCGDPDGLVAERWWNGREWTHRVRDLVNGESLQSSDQAGDLTSFPVPVPARPWNGDADTPWKRPSPDKVLVLSGSLLIFGPFAVGALMFVGGTYEAVIPAYFITMITAPIGIVVWIAGLVVRVSRRGDNSNG